MDKARKVEKGSKIGGYDHGSQGGFTLIELLIIMIVMGLLAVFIIPMYTATIAESKTTASANNFSHSVKMARSEAIRANDQVSVCARKTDTSCGDDWNNGWLVVNNQGGGNIASGGAITSPSTNVLRIDAVREDVMIPDTPASSVSLLTFAADGTRSAKSNWPPSPTGTTDTFSFVNDNSPSYKLGVRVSVAGQVTQREL